MRFNTRLPLWRRFTNSFIRNWNKIFLGILIASSSFIAGRITATHLDNLISWRKQNAEIQRITNKRNPFRHPITYGTGYPLLSTYTIYGKIAEKSGWKNPLSFEHTGIKDAERIINGELNWLQRKFLEKYSEWDTIPVSIKRKLRKDYFEEYKKFVSRIGKKELAGIIYAESSFKPWAVNFEVIGSGKNRYLKPITRAGTFLDNGLGQTTPSALEQAIEDQVIPKGTDIRHFRFIMPEKAIKREEETLRKYYKADPSRITSVYRRELREFEESLEKKLGRKPTEAELLKAIGEENERRLRKLVLPTTVNTAFFNAATAFSRAPETALQKPTKLLEASYRRGGTGAAKAIKEGVWNRIDENYSRRRNEGRKLAHQFSFFEGIKKEKPPELKPIYYWPTLVPWTLWMTRIGWQLAREKRELMPQFLRFIDGRPETRRRRKKMK